LGGTASAENIDDFLISRLINSGEIEAARNALNSQRPSDLERIFFEGRILKSQGQLLDAIQVFRRVLQLDPNHINARRELAHTLLLNRDYEPAEHHFTALLDIDHNGGMRDGYRRFLNVIDQNRPIGFGGYFSLLPTTNVNLGTTNTVFDTNLGQFVIDATSQPKSGIGAGFGISGYFRHVIDSKSRVALNWGLSGVRYENKLFNNTVGNVALSFEQVTRSGNWLVSPYYRRLWRQDKADYNALGLKFGHTRRLNDAVQLSFSLGHESRTYPNRSFQNGGLDVGSVGLKHQITSSFSLQAGFEVERSAAEAAHLQYDAYKLFAGLSKSWQGGLHTSLGLEVGQRRYVGVYPLTSSARDDDFYKIRVGVQHSQIDLKGFTPRLSCTHTINMSNVAFFDYNVTECQATISRNF
jgi:hypothetical protein